MGWEGPNLDIEVAAEVLPDPAILAGLPCDLVVIQQAQLRDDVRLRMNSQCFMKAPCSATCHQAGSCLAGLCHMPPVCCGAYH